jgi:hypothetical protein
MRTPKIQLYDGVAVDIEATLNMVAPTPCSCSIFVRGPASDLVEGKENMVPDHYE